MTEKNEFSSGATRAVTYTTLSRFLDDEVFWNGARFKGLLCLADGTPVPLESDMRDDGTLFVLEGTVVHADGQALSVGEFFERWCASGR